MVHWGMETSARKGGHRRCVVWHQSGAQSPRALVRALSSRGLRVETSGSAHEVLAIACAEQRRADEGRGGMIVVLDGGGRELDEQSRVLSAMERFCPMARVWVYEEGANPPLRGFVDMTKKVATPETDVEPPVEEKAGSASRPALRIVGSNGSGSTLKASDVLDQDELSALLRPSDLD